MLCKHSVVYTWMTGEVKREPVCVYMCMCGLVNRRLEAEIAVRQGVEQDITNLRKMIDDTHMNRMQLESEVEALTEELIFLKKSHEEVPLKS